jgi:hypothetical protein
MKQIVIPAMIDCVEAGRVSQPCFKKLPKKMIAITAAAAGGMLRS